MEHTVVNRTKLLHVKFKRPVTILNKYGMGCDGWIDIIEIIMKYHNEMKVVKS